MHDQALVKEAAREAADWSASLPTVRALIIESTEDFELASEAVKHARANWKKLEERRKSVTQPMMAAKAGVDALFKPALEILLEIEGTLKAKIGAYIEAQRSAQVQAMNAAGAVFAAGGEPSAMIPEVPTSKGISVKSVWEAEVTDPEAVPRDLCSPDLDKINERIRYADTTRTPPRPIPGLAFKLRTSVTVRVK